MSMVINILKLVFFRTSQNMSKSMNEFSHLQNGDIQHQNHQQHFPHKYQQNDFASRTHGHDFGYHAMDRYNVIKF